MLSPEVNSQITLAIAGALVLIIPAATTAIVAFLNKKTREWHEDKQTIIDLAQQAKEYSQGNRKLLEETIERTTRIEKQSDGMSARLRAIASENAFQAGKNLGEMKTAGVPTDELESLESEFRDHMQQATNSASKPCP